MHGQQNIKICDAKQAKQVHQYKTTKIKLYKSNAAIWYNKTCRIKQHNTRDSVIQLWPPDDEHMCSKHVEAWNKLIVKQKFCASSWLITNINKLRCMVDVLCLQTWHYIGLFVLALAHQLQ